MTRTPPSHLNATIDVGKRKTDRKTGDGTGDRARERRGDYLNAGTGNAQHRVPGDVMERGMVAADLNNCASSTGIGEKYVK